MKLRDVFDDIIGTTKQTFEILKDGGVDVIGLYMFYYYTAKWQGTNQPHCTVSYVCNGLNISKARVKKARAYLIESGLITDVQKRKKDGSGFSKVYTKINYIFTNKALEQHDSCGGLVSGGPRQWGAQNHTPNAGSINNKMLKEKKEILEADIKKIYNYWQMIKEKDIYWKGNRKLDDNIKSILKAIFKNYSKEDIEIGIKNYINDTQKRKKDNGGYYKHRFSLQEFFTQKNGFKKFYNIID